MLRESSPNGKSPAEILPGLRFELTDSADVAARQALESGLAALQFCTRGTLAGETDAIHQFRISIRKLRVAVELFAPLLHGSRVRIYRFGLARIGAAAGAVRDCDVIADLIRENTRRLDPELARALLPMYQSLTDRRLRTMRAMHDLLCSKYFSQLSERLANPLTRKTNLDQSLRLLSAILLKPLIRGVGRAGSGLGPASPPSAFHRLRIRVKRLRYAFEMFDQISGKRIAKALKRLRRIQQELGEYQDLSSASIWVREFASHRLVDSPETLVASGSLLQLFNQRREKLAARSLKIWDKLKLERAMIKASAEIDQLTRMEMITESIEVSRT